MLPSKPARSNKHSPGRREYGFTLIEILVAIGIFAMLSVSAYTVLNQVQRSNQQSLEKTDRLKAIQRAMVIIDNDFRQIALRSFRTNGEEASENIIFWGDGLLNSDDKAVLFTRLGWHNPQQMFPRGEITKVGYRINGGTLERVWWRYPDTPVAQEGVVTPLLEDAEKLDLSFYKEESWTGTWNEAYALPKAVRFSITLQDYGEIERVYLTAGESLQKTDDSAGQ